MQRAPRRRHQDLARLRLRRAHLELAAPQFCLLDQTRAERSPRLPLHFHIACDRAASRRTAPARRQRRAQECPSHFSDIPSRKNRRPDDV